MKKLFSEFLCLRRSVEFCIKTLFSTVAFKGLVEMWLSKWNNSESKWTVEYFSFICVNQMAYCRSYSDRLLLFTEYSIRHSRWSALCVAKKCLKFLAFFQWHQSYFHPASICHNSTKTPPKWLVDKNSFVWFVIIRVFQSHAIFHQNSSRAILKINAQKCPIRWDFS